MEMMEEARAKVLAGEDLPADPLTLALEWYNATSETWSKFAGDLIGTEGFVEAASRFLQSYTGFVKTFRYLCEEYLRNIQLPTRADVARVAGLVVALEDKVDHLEEAFDDGYTKLATAEALGYTLTPLEEEPLFRRYLGFP